MCSHQPFWCKNVNLRFVDVFCDSFKKIIFRKAVTAKLMGIFRNQCAPLMILLLVGIMVIVYTLNFFLSLGDVSIAQTSRGLKCVAMQGTF